MIVPPNIQYRVGSTRQVSMGDFVDVLLAGRAVLRRGPDIKSGFFQVTDSIVQGVVNP